MPFQVVSQLTSVNWGPQLKDKFGTTTTQIVGSDANGFYTIRTNFMGDDMFLEYYNNNNDLTSSQKPEN